MSKVIIAGTFDLFHVGHLELFKRAYKLGGIIALVNTDRFVKEFKGIVPTINEEDRRKIVESLYCVSHAFLNDNADLTKTIDKYIEDDYEICGVVFGDDYDIEKYRKQTGITREWQQKHDIALIQFPRTDGISSTQIRQTLK